jgi:hypothetical protein
MSENALTKLVRAKARFDSPQGLLTVEDLWDVPLTSSKSKANLDDMARALSKQVKEAETESFVVKPPKADNIVAAKFEYIKEVIETRLAENEAATLAKINKETKQKLMEIQDRKKDKQYEEMTPEELQKLIDSMPG